MTLSFKSQTHNPHLPKDDVFPSNYYRMLVESTITTLPSTFFRVLSCRLHCYSILRTTRIAPLLCNQHWLGESTNVVFGIVQFSKTYFIATLWIYPLALIAPVAVGRRVLCWWRVL